MSSLIKYLDQREGNERGRLYWGRLGEDGLPFRGNNVPLYRSEEWDERLVRVGDFKNGSFNLQDPEQNRRFLEVMDRALNGWYALFKRHDDFEHDKQTVYLEWAELYLEDGGARLGPPAAAFGSPG